VAAGEPLVIIDLRPGDLLSRRASRLEVAASLGGVQGLEPVDDAELTAALAGEPSDDAGRRAVAALDQAIAAHGRSDCTAARAAATTAVDGLTAAQAGGDPVGDALIQAHAIVLVCADGAGDHPAAQRAAAWLRRLGTADPPPGVAEAVWSRYPAIDSAGQRELVEITIDAPAGARARIDHQPVGDAPATAVVAQGEHLFAAATGRGRASVRAMIEQEGARVSVPVVEAASRWGNAAAMVRSWRDGSGSANALALGQLMAEVGVRVAVVLSGSDQLEAWGRGRKDATAHRITAGKTSRPFPVGSAIVAQVESWEGTTATTTVVPRGDEAQPRQKWWVYAAILGAIGVAGTLILANDLADDRQRIEVRWP